LLAAVLLSGCAQGRQDTSAAAPATPDSSPAVTSSATPSPASTEPAGHDHEGEGTLYYTPGPSTEPTREAAELAERFARLWARPTAPPGQWFDDLAPLCTSTLATDLRTADPANAPTSRITGKPKSVISRTGEAVFEVPTAGGTLVIGALDVPGEGWRVAKVDFRRPGA
jgi:hypothetical protein